MPSLGGAHARSRGRGLNVSAGRKSAAFGKWLRTHFHSVSKAPSSRRAPGPALRTICPSVDAPGGDSCADDVSGRDGPGASDAEAMLVVCASRALRGGSLRSLSQPEMATAESEMRNAAACSPYGRFDERRVL